MTKAVDVDLEMRNGEWIKKDNPGGSILDSSLVPPKVEKRFRKYWSKLEELGRDEK